jgi:hypothetical protein
LVESNTWATNSFSMWDNKDLLIVDHFEHVLCF